MAWEPRDILIRLTESSPNESSHELYCRCVDAAEEVARLRDALKKLESRLLLPTTPERLEDHGPQLQRHWSD